MTVQKHVRFDGDTLKLVEDWRRTQTPIPTFNQAINTLLKAKIVYVPQLTSEVFKLKTDWPVEAKE
jgi:hypothetical protein